MWTYRILFGFDALALLVLGFFFIDGLQYVDAEGLTIWFVMIGVPIVTLVGAEILRQNGKRGIGSVLLAVLAVPPALFAAFFGLMIALNPTWQ